MNPAAILKLKNKPVMWLINVVIVLVILIIVYKLYQKFKRDIKGSIRNSQIEHDIKDIVNTQGSDPGAQVTSNVRTYNDADYKLMAESLFEAMDGLTEDEDSIFAIFHLYAQKLTGMRWSMLSVLVNLKVGGVT